MVGTVARIMLPKSNPPAWVALLLGRCFHKATIHMVGTVARIMLPYGNLLACVALWQ